MDKKDFNEIEKMQDVLTNEEIAIRLVEVWANSECSYIDEILKSYDIALEHLNKEDK